MNILKFSTIAALLIIFHCSNNASVNNKVLVLGIDGMDPLILGELMDAGKMPNFSLLAEHGEYAELQSSTPPQSPVAWANFITGMDPGGHGIFDFVHRYPETLMPYLSVSETVPASWSFTLGNWTIPLRGGTVKNLRKGKAFWEILEEHDIPTMILGIPSNFPPINKGKSLSGMGTPDILGSYGEFTFFTSDTATAFDDISGGRVVRVTVENNVIKTSFKGSANPFLKDNKETSVPFSIYIDENTPTIRLDIAEQKYILKEGEWSHWIPLEFELVPYLSSYSGICRLYLKQVRPYFQLYVSPININPDNPVMPISNPEDFSQILYRDLGYFYTQGMAEDTKALEFGILDDDAFKTLSLFIMEERLRLLDWAMTRFKEGLLFVYFSSLDQNSHMYYKTLFPDSSGDSFTAYNGNRLFLESLYTAMDTLLGKTLEQIDDRTTVFVMSDHGFAPFEKKVNLNTWLFEQNYISMFRQWDQKYDKFFQTVSWAETKAYALGLNGIYINQDGRESNGTVTAEDKKTLVDEIADKLLTLRDPETGEQIIKRVYKTAETYHGKHKDTAPDIIVGYARGFRSSDASAMGEFPEGLTVKNTDRWSGDHCMATEEVPGVLLMNKKFQSRTPHLYDLAPTILQVFGIPVPEYMYGKSIL